ncbi:MAG: substrate-binding domain-containing protein [Acidobacteriaceae bacterium]|nr:substrate-binding domain-containing protein [Acidobacteriaceae bacterium]
MPTLCAEDRLPIYSPQQTVSGTIRIWGHGAEGKDFIRTLVLNWEAGFQKYQPNVQFDNQLMGTASAIGALYTGTGDLALLGREIWPDEIQAFREVLHYPPLGMEITTGSYATRNKDFALIVYVHTDNPLSRLTLSQVGRIFGCHTDEAANIRSWSQLGMTGEWADKPIHVYGFEISRGFGFYMEQTVFHGSSKWNPDMVEIGDQHLPTGKLLDAGKRILDALANDPLGIAYSSALYANDKVKPIALAIRDSGPYVEPTLETVQNRSYPLTRVIPMFLNRKPGRPVDPKVKEFLRYILSQQGQDAVAQDRGYLPLTPEVVRTQLQKLQ